MFVGRSLSTLVRSASGLFFPRVCLACQAVLEIEEADLCDACREELAIFRGHTCGRCGAPVSLPQDPAARCVHCEKDSLGFDAAIAFGSYEGLLRQLVLQAKEVTGETVASVLGRMLASAVAQRAVEERFDLVTGVPMHWRRRLARRHNAPDLMAEVVAHSVEARYRPRLLTLTRSTSKQAELAATQRRRNLRGAFHARSTRALRGAVVALVDDILTTGATCSEAAKALKAAGAKRVVAVVVARSL